MSPIERHRRRYIDEHDHREDYPGGGGSGGGSGRPGRCDVRLAAGHRDTVFGVGGKREGGQD